MKPNKFKLKWRKDIDKDYIREQILDDKRLTELGNQKELEALIGKEKK